MEDYIFSKEFEQITEELKVKIEEKQLKELTDEMLKELKAFGITTIEGIDLNEIVSYRIPTWDLQSVLNINIEYSDEFHKFYEKWYHFSKTENKWRIGKYMDYSPRH